MNSLNTHKRAQHWKVQVLQFCSFLIRVSPQPHYLWTPLPKVYGQWPAFGGVFALRAHCACTARYF